MKHKINLSVAVCAALILLNVLASCKDDSFKVKGEIYGAENRSLTLEKAGFDGYWIAIDSTRISRNGSFSFKSPRQAAPEIFRISIDGRYIYFPIDSTETITVNSSLDKFGTEFTLSGSDHAALLEKFEKDILAIPSNISPESLVEKKKTIYSEYIKDNPGSIVNFYILTKTIDGRAIFDPENPDDLKYFAAVATGFRSARPDDPRTPLLEQVSIEAMKKRNSEKGTYLEISAEEKGLIDISLNDEKGNPVKLSDIAGKGKPTVVIFSFLTHPDSPAINYELSRIYNSHAGNVEFYNVSLDPDQYAWRDAAVNLPWVTVFDPEREYSKPAADYNVVDMPTFFLYNAGGDLVARPQTLDELNSLLNAH